MNYREGFLKITWFHQRYIMSEDTPENIYSSLSDTEKYWLLSEYLDYLEGELRYLKAKLLR